MENLSCFLSQLGSCFGGKNGGYKTFKGSWNWENTDTIGWLLIGDPFLGVKHFAWSSADY